MRHYTFEDSAVVSDLKYWGFHKGKQCAADGYSPEDTLAQLLSGRSEHNGHRILCLDMPPRAWEINGRIMGQLPTDYIAALIGRYCLPVKDQTGHPFEPYEIAEALKVPIRTYQYRLTQAKKFYRRLMFGAEILELQSQGMI